MKVNQRSILLAVCTVWALASGPVFGQGRTTRQHRRNVEAGLLRAVTVKGDAASERDLVDEMNRLHVPGVSISIIHKGKIEWSEGYGVTARGGTRVVPQTLFQAGSVSKPVAALCIMRLAQQGTISLDEDVNHTLKGWKLPESSFMASRPVTPRDLLSHTAGTTVHGFEGYKRGDRVPSLSEVLDGVTPANSEPVRVTQAVGEQYRYSGGGYIILQQLAEDATHSPFAELAKTIVLKPIGMSRSSFQQPLDLSSKTSVAMPYDSSGTPIAGGPHTYPELAAAGLWTTSPDLARFVLAVQRSRQGESTKILSAQNMRQMLTPVKSDWSLGFEIGGSPAAPYFYHDGANQGYKATLVGYEHGGDGAVIMTNGDQGYELGLEIVRSIAKEYEWPDFHPITRTMLPMNAAAQSEFIGHYTIQDLGDFEVRLDGAILVAEIHAGVLEPLLASSDRSFFVTSQDLQMEFSSSVHPAGGQIHAGAFHAVFKRLP